MFSKDRNDSSLEQHRGVRLGLKNVRIWVKDIVENRSMHFEEAGEMVRQVKRLLIENQHAEIESRGLIRKIFSPNFYLTNSLLLSGQMQKLE